jgi:uncharacterized delta-60 repeat protein
MRHVSSRYVPRVTIAVLASVLVFASMPNAFAHPGDVDGTFGTAGWTGITDSWNRIAGVVRRADGSLIAGASSGAMFQAIGLTSGGNPLSGYGAGGIASVAIPGASSANATDIAARPDGRVIEAGYGYATTGTDFLVVARFGPRGHPDTSFSHDGVATIRFPFDAYGYGLAIQPDGKIVVAGEIDPSNSTSNPAVIRLNPNGTLDKSFGTLGRRIPKVPDGVAGYDGAWRVAIGPSGNLVMSGWVARVNHNYKTLVIRMHPSGALDRTFSGNGFAVLDPDGTNNWAYAMALDGTKIVLGLHTNSGAAGFLRVLPNGQRDRTFGVDGFAQHMLSVPWEVGAIAVMSDHKIIGTSDNSGDPNVVRLMPGGHLDTSFGTNGEAVGPVASASGYGIKILPIGKIVVVGGVSGQVIVTRFLGG